MARTSLLLLVVKEPIKNNIHVYGYIHNSFCEAVFYFLRETVAVGFCEKEPVGRRLRE